MKRSNEPLFTFTETMNAVSEYRHFIDRMEEAKNIKQWNEARDSINREFDGPMEKRLALFGYIDGILHAQLFGKLSGI
jgi:hypothetical protein